jgi:pimeloyl-ACP methyl ester carboxylesterase
MSTVKRVVRIENIALERVIPDSSRGGPRLLFLHSAGHGSWMWENFLSFFGGLGFDSWALNFRGHYLAPKVDDWGAVGTEAYLDDLDRAVKEIGENVVIVGHSMSGVLALKYAEGRNLAGIIVSQSGAPMPLLKKMGIGLEGPLGGPRGEDRGKTGAVIEPHRDREKILTTVFDRDNVDSGVVDLVLEKMGPESARIGGEIMDMVLEPEKVKAPVYILGFDITKSGRKMPVNMDEVLSEAYRAKRVVSLKPGGHNYMLERNWRDYAELFLQWIEEV